MTPEFNPHVCKRYVWEKVNAHKEMPPAKPMFPEALKLHKKLDVLGDKSPYWWAEIKIDCYCKDWTGAFVCSMRTCFPGKSLLVHYVPHRLIPDNVSLEIQEFVLREMEKDAIKLGENLITVSTKTKFSSKILKKMGYVKYDKFSLWIKEISRQEVL